MNTPLTDNLGSDLHISLKAWVQRLMFDGCIKIGSGRDTLGLKRFHPIAANAMEERVVRSSVYPTKYFQRDSRVIINKPYFRIYRMHRDVHSFLPQSMVEKKGNNMV